MTKRESEEETNTDKKWAKKLKIEKKTNIMKRIEYIQSKKNKSSKNTHIIYIEIVLYKHRIENTTRDTQ